MQWPVSDAKVDDERDAKFREGPPRLPRKVIWIALAAFAVLGVGGAFADQSFNIPPAAQPTPVHHATHESTSLAQFLGLTELSGAHAAAFRLVTDRGIVRTLGTFSGRPVILTFLPAPCAQTCPVVAGELEVAMNDLAQKAVHVSVVVVNADPDVLAPMATAPLVRADKLGTIPGAIFLTGSLSTLQRIWRAYGVSIEVDTALHTLAYTSVIYLLDKTGRVKYSMTPFANESENGMASLPRSEITHYGKGIASYVERLAR